VRCCSARKTSDGNGVLSRAKHSVRLHEGRDEKPRPAGTACIDIWINGKYGKYDMRHIISVLLENEPGALSRVIGLFSARGYNIETLTVAPTEDQSLSRLTIVSVGSDDVIEQITKHLNRLIEVVKVVDLTEGAHIERELMLIKVRAVGKEREEMKRMADIFRGRIIDVTEKTYTIELTGASDKLDAFIEGLDATVILETVRTGSSGIGRGERILKV
jgi:acetolactate synthase-1/3 small subunit